MKEANFKALLPIGVFLVLYLGLGILFEYVLKVGMGFYNIPIVVVFVIALLVACLQNKSLSFDEKLGVMAKSALIEDKVGGGMLNWMTHIFGTGVDISVKFFGNAL